MTEVIERLAGWLRSVNLDPGASRQQAIEKAAASLAKESSGRALLDLVLMAHGESAPAASTRVSELLHDQDETWQVRPGDLEASLTAATATALGMDSEPATAVRFALAVHSAAFSELKPTVADLPGLARASLATASEAIRARVPLSAAQPDIKGAFGEIPELGDAIDLEALKAVIKAASSASTRVAAVTTKLLPSLNLRLDAADEELDLLWWVLGGFSELADRPFEDVPEQAAGCVAGIELASHVKTKCPLPSTRAILSRVLRGQAATEIDLARAVPATCQLIGEEWVPELEGHRLLPVLSSAREYVALSGRSTWKESITRWEIEAGHQTSSLQLAEQVSHELLLLSVG